MKRLSLTFLSNPNKPFDLNPLEAILHEFGQEIYEYAKGYFNYVVTTSSVCNEIEEASLYIIVPEIGYDYKILELTYKDVETVELKYFTLKTEQFEIDNLSIKTNWDLVYSRISQLLNTTLANQTFRFLVDQVVLKRENNSE